MTKQEVIDRVALIATLVNDDEAAHCAEDELHADVLRAIAAGSCEDPPGCAAEALKTNDLDFARWCA